MLTSSLIIFIISNAVTLRRDKTIIYSRFVFSLLIACLIIGLESFYINSIKQGIGLFGGLYITNPIGLCFFLFIFFITSIIILLNSFYPRKIIFPISLRDFIYNNWLSSMFNWLRYKIVYLSSFILNKKGGQFKILEYPLLVMFVVVGNMLLISSSDLVSMFLSIELQSYGLYILCTVYRDSEQATSGGLTYFLLGGLSSCFILLGSGFLYGNSGNTTFDALFVIDNLSNTYTSLEENSIIYQSSYILVALVIISVGFLFKISAAPFHFWSPDVYDAIPTVVTTFVANIAKVSILVLLLELVHYTTNYVSNENFSWTIVFLFSSLLSLIIGAVLGLTQFRIKRLYAYSTISHLGFILLALTINTIESIQSFIFYTMQYIMSNINAFLLLNIIGYFLFFYMEKKDTHNNNYGNTEKLSDLINSPVQLISQLKGLFYINPVLSLSFSITLFSFVGIPPLVGFFAKQMVLSSALDNGYVFMTLVAILSSVISAYYYLAIVKQMFFDETNYVLNTTLKDLSLTGNIVNRFNNKSINTIKIKINDVKLNSSLTTIVSLFTIIIILFILLPEEWLSLTSILSILLFNN